MHLTVNIKQMKTLATKRAVLSHHIEVTGGSIVLLTFVLNKPFLNCVYFIQNTYLSVNYRPNAQSVNDSILLLQ